MRRRLSVSVVCGALTCEDWRGHRCRRARYVSGLGYQCSVWWRILEPEVGLLKRCPECLRAEAVHREMVATGGDDEQG